MWFRINIDTNAILRNQKAKMKNKLDKFTDIVLDKINEKTPEDTKELLWNNQRSEIIENGDKLYSRVFNDTEYAPYVEYWVWREFKYNKPKWKIFFTWIWAWMYWRTWKEVKDKFYQLTK